jgi:hypothetical protein
MILWGLWTNGRGSPTWYRESARSRPHPLRKIISLLCFDSIALLARHGRLNHATCSPWPSPLSRRASTMDAPASRRGEELRVTPPRRRVACVAITPASSMHYRCLRAGVELRNDEPPFVPVARWHCAKSVCCRRMF